MCVLTQQREKWRRRPISFPAVKVPTYLSLSHFQGHLHAYHPRPRPCCAPSTGTLSFLPRVQPRSRPPGQASPDTSMLRIACAGKFRCSQQSLHTGWDGLVCAAPPQAPGGPRVHGGAFWRQDLSSASQPCSRVQHPGLTCSPSRWPPSTAARFSGTFSKYFYDTCKVAASGQSKQKAL